MKHTSNFLSVADVMVSAVLVGGSGQVLAANFYAGGDDASNRNLGTASHPFAAIQKAAGVAAAGDVVNIRPGSSSARGTRCRSWSLCATVYSLTVLSWARVDPGTANK